VAAAVVIRAEVVVVAVIVANHQVASEWLSLQVAISFSVEEGS